MRRATPRAIKGGVVLQISIHALREESDDYLLKVLENALISIHALREESDNRLTELATTVFISIHALREESDMR